MMKSIVIGFLVIDPNRPPLINRSFDGLGIGIPTERQDRVIVALVDLAIESHGDDQPDTL